MCKIRALFFLFLISVNVLFAQNYQITTTHKNMVKTTSHGIMHEFIQIDNLIGVDFGMRWVALQGSKSGCPSQWDIGVSDPDSAYATVSDNDSADFILSGTNNTNNKIILSVNHNGTIGDCAFNFKVYPLSDSSDFTVIGFNISVTPGSTSIVELGLKSEEYGYPNPVRDTYFFENKVKQFKLFNLSGKLLKEGVEATLIQMSNLPKGTFIVLLEKTDGNFDSFRIIK